MTRLALQDKTDGSRVLTGSAVVPLNAPQPSALTSEQLIERLMEAEPPEIYLMKDMKKPLTEAKVMMSLTNLADKELVHMITWAKKIPGLCRGIFKKKKPERKQLHNTHFLETSVSVVAFVHCGSL